MARPRKATALLRSSGAFVRNPQRETARNFEPKPAGPLGNAPAHLNAAKQATWNELAQLLPKGLAGDLDRVAFEILTALLSKFRHDRGSMRSAEYSLMAQMITKFGLTPADRSRVSVVCGDKPVDRLEAFLGEKYFDP